MSIQEFLDLKLSPNTYPVSLGLQKMIADIETDNDDPLVEAVANSVVDLEIKLVNTKAALIHAQTLSAQIVAWAFGLETRLIEARIGIKSAQQEMNDLAETVREAPPI